MLREIKKATDSSHGQAFSHTAVKLLQRLRNLQTGMHKEQTHISSRSSSCNPAQDFQFQPQQSLKQSIKVFDIHHSVINTYR
jgi:hypothetical protein